MEETYKDLKDLSLQDKAVYVPVQYFDISLNAEGKSSRPPALLFTLDNLISIKKYVRWAFARPVDISAVEEFLGYRDSGINGLQPVDIQALHQEVVQHALDWQALEQGSKRLGIELDIFGKKFVGVGQAIITFIKQTEAYKQYGSLDDLKEEEIEALQNYPLSETDRTSIRYIQEFLTIAKDDIARYQSKVAAVRALAREFARKITEAILPKVRQKRAIADREGLEETIAGYVESLRDLEGQVAEKIAEYNQNVGYALSGLLFGPIGVAVTGGIYGSKAEQIRYEKNEMLNQTAEIIELLRVKRPLLSSLNGLSLYLEDVASRLGETEHASKNLEDVWQIIAAYVEASLTELNAIDDSQRLVIFSLRFSRVITPWETIQGHAEQLSKLFNEALEASTSTTANPISK
ncbi:alpha-xenorhabdolysin family binary toxin subunit A [Pseudomonas sp. LS1212]|uniref:alpha-xenorhabdolysin family binary toxin subunit A n=1 Tax=Pseudomonas sp. LS1212 TaxID=2972478 RepID=UPI00215BB47F|nr:alpha-xenorhabdolysin family binary toxin subunit A [Pseudomonas sp. LS1212]UVJ43079.1 alpha-xenorhabdolysin family binary toxin subunit A [Pseudomonas sp. LS1212]